MSHPHGTPEVRTPGAHESELRGVAALATSGLLFGSTFLVMKSAVVKVEPVAFIAMRFGLAIFVLWPFARRRPVTPGLLRDGALAGAALLAGFLLQVYGLKWTTSSRSAFISYLLIVLVPLMEAVLTRRRPRAATLVAVTVAMVGLALIVDVGAGGGIGRGEWLSFGCAFAFGAQIVVLGRIAHRHDPLRLTLVQLCVVALSCALITVPVGVGHLDASVYAAIAYTGIFTTALAFVLMVAGQRVVPSSRAALVLLLELVSAAILGYLAGDRLGARGAVGAVCIVVAIVISERQRRGAAVPTPVGVL